MRKIYIPKESEKYQIVIGTAKGYNNENYMDKDEFMKILYVVQSDVAKAHNFFVSFNVFESKVQYDKEHGCPDLGEKVFTLEATRNPKFVQNESAFRMAILTIAEKLQKILKQNTVTVTCSNVSHYYMTNTEDNEGEE